VQAATSSRCRPKGAEGAGVARKKAVNLSTMSRLIGLHQSFSFFAVRTEIQVTK
jgi:hypothetical protein